MLIKEKKNGRKYIEIMLPKRIGVIEDWCDNDHLMFLSIGMLFEDCVVGEMGGLKKLNKQLKWVKGEIADENNEQWDIDYWKWWLPLLTEIINLLKFWNAFETFRRKIEKRYLSSGCDLKYWVYWEDKLLQLEDQFMRRVIEIRGCLWT